MTAAVVDSFTLYHFVVSSPAPCSPEQPALDLLNGFTGVFFFFLKMLNFEVFSLAVVASSFELSVASSRRLNLFTLVFPCFQNFGNLLDFFVFSCAVSVKNDDTLLNSVPNYSLLGFLFFTFCVGFLNIVCILLYRQDLSGRQAVRGALEDLVNIRWLPYHGEGH